MRLEGILLLIDGKAYLRVKANNVDGFEDIEIIHSDLSIIVNDNDTAIRIDSNGDKYLDHCDATLGYT